MNKDLITASDEYHKDVRYFLRYAREEWLMVGLVFGGAWATILSVMNVDSTTTDDVVTIGEAMLADLFDQGVLAGDLTDGDPGFEQWPGNAQDWLARIRAWIEHNGDIPDPGECCWLHDPTGGSRQAAVYL